MLQHTYTSVDRVSSRLLQTSTYHRFPWLCWPCRLTLILWSKGHSTRSLWWCCQTTGGRSREGLLKIGICGRLDSRGSIMTPWKTCSPGLIGLNKAHLAQRPCLACWMGTEARSIGCSSPGLSLLFRRFLSSGACLRLTFLCRFWEGHFLNFHLRCTHKALQRDQKCK